MQLASAFLQLSTKSQSLELAVSSSAGWALKYQLKIVTTYLICVYLSLYYRSNEMTVRVKERLAKNARILHVTTMCKEGG